MPRFESSEYNSFQGLPGYSKTTSLDLSAKPPSMNMHIIEFAVDSNPCSNKIAIGNPFAGRNNSGGINGSPLLAISCVTLGEFRISAVITCQCLRQGFFLGFCSSSKFNNGAILEPN